MDGVSTIRDAGELGGVARAGARAVRGVRVQ
jgi:hypothetical protein